MVKYNQMKKMYAFILGTNPALSVAEIFAVFERDGYEYSVADTSNEILLIETSGIEGSFLDGLGGTIKIVEILGTLENKEFDPGKVVEFASVTIQDLNQESKGKFHFGISVYELGSPKKILFRVSRSVRYIYINLKKNLRGDGINLAFVNSNEKNLSSASVLKNGLVSESGMELSLIVSETQIYAGKTLSVQNIDLYTKLDMGRPRRDLVSGTTPPKLAKIMINMAEKDKSSVMLDPFCGSGTYLQEMILLGYGDITGSDISQKATDDTKENLEWLQDEVVNEKLNYKVYTADAKELSGIISPKTVDAVVGEVYLGPPFRGHTPETQIESTIKELTTLYTDVLSEIGKIIKDDGVIVLAFPAYKTQRGYQLLPLEEAIAVNGLEFKKSDVKNFSNFFTRRGTYLYSRESQFVCREIMILTKIVK